MKTLVSFNSDIVECKGKEYSDEEVADIVLIAT